MYNVIHIENKVDVERLIKPLTQDQKKLIDMIYYEDLSYEQVAEIEGKTSRTIRYQIKDIISKMKKAA